MPMAKGNQKLSRQVVLSKRKQKINLRKKIAKKYTKPYNALRTIVSANEIQFLHKIKQNISANTLTPFI